MIRGGTVGEVVALGTATPRTHVIHGREVTTAIVRDPIAGPLKFTLQGPENNKPAVHTEQVLAFSAEHYDYWAAQLGVDRGDWPWVYWGENITLTGVNENTLRIGDLVQIGEVLFETTAPRLPCFKLSWRLNQPDDILPRIMQSGFVGHYLRVKEPGSISVGDPVSIKATGKTMISVGDVARLVLDLQPEQLAVAREAVALPELGDLARMALSQKINQLEDVIRCRPNRWKGWRRFRISAVRDEAAGVKSVELEPRDGAPAAYKAGQHVTLRVGSEPHHLRIWSLSDYVGEPDRYRITVKRGTGDGSRWIHEQAQVGMEVDVRAPSGQFVLDRSSFSRAVFISAGVGATPLVSMLKAHVERWDAPGVVWLHSTRNAASHILAEEVDSILASSERFLRQVHYTARAPGDETGSHDRQGRITRGDIEAIVTSTFLSPTGGIQIPGEYSHYYVCGADQFTADITAMLTDLGVDAAQIFTERFAGGDAGAYPDAAVDEAQITFASSNLTATWDSSLDLTLLELAEEADIAAPFACRSGMCGSCEAPLIEGSVRYAPIPSHVPAPGACLPCCARPASARVTLKL